MPHLTVEYTNSLDIDRQHLLVVLNTMLDNTGLFQTIDIKSRCIALEQWQVGVTSSDAAFVHLTLKLLSGRDNETKQQLSRLLLDGVMGNFSLLHGTQVSVDIVDLDRSCYGKAVV